MQNALRFDTASAISKGSRDYQEDAIISDFTAGSDLSMVVLADGMGGHAAGDVASKVVVTEVFRELTFKRDAMTTGKLKITDVLRNAASVANTCLAQLVEQFPEHKGMGATLLGVIFHGNALHWVSIGDSPLFLFRDNELRQLNEDHSLGPHIEYLHKTGTLTDEEAENHPERNVLTSVLSGQDVPLIDCPQSSFTLLPGDVILVASDGLQYLSNDAIARVLRDRPMCRSSELADALMEGVMALNNSDLDNVTFEAIQVRHAPTLTLVSPEPKPERAWSFGALGRVARGVQ